MTKLFDGSEPIYQPLLSVGIRYREPTSRSTQTGWFRGDQEITREEAAAYLGVEIAELIRWENATDLEAETEARADFGDY
jgi:hypothetical protein